MDKIKHSSINSSDVLHPYRRCALYSSIKRSTELQKDEYRNKSTVWS